MGSGRSLVDRYQEKVEVHGPDDCWPWTGARDDDGYGRMRTGSRANGTRRMEMATRVGWRLLHGSDPTGLVCHTCDTPWCQNPAHWYDGTHQSNSQDMKDRARHPKRQITHCPKNHEYTPENTVIKPDGTRRCRQCANERRNTGVGQGTKQRKLTEQQVLEIRQLLKAKVPQKEIAEKFGVTRYNIQSISSGKTWRWIKEN